MKLRSQFLILFLVSTFIVFVLVAGWGVYSIRDVQARSLALLQSELNKSVAQNISAFIQNKVKSYSIQVVTDELQEVSLVQQQYILGEIIKSDKSILEISVLSRAGRETNRIEQDQTNFSQTNQDYSAQPWFLGVSKSENYFGPVATEQNLRVMDMAFPILNSNKKFIGALLLKVDLSDVQTLLDRSQLGATGYTYLVDEGRNLLLSPGLKQVNPEQDELLLDKAKFAQATLRQSVDFDYRGLSGETVRGVISQVPLVNWSVISEWPVASVWSLILLNLWQLLLIGSIGIIMVFVIAWLFAREVFGKLSQIQEGFSIISRGNYKYRIKLPVGDELADLSELINQFAETEEKK